MCSIKKKCPKCGIEKPLTSEFFGIESRSKTGFTSRCKICNLRTSGKFREIKKEKESGFRVCSSCCEKKPIDEFKKPYKDGFSLIRKCKSCHAESMRKNRIKNKTVNPEYNAIREKLNSARKRAKENRYSFDISIEDLMPFPSHCEVFGIKLDYVAFGYERVESLATIDKVIPELGYTKGNVRIISMKANRMKSDMSLKDIEAIRDYIIKNGGR